MTALLRPRWLILAALGALVIALAGFMLGWSSGSAVGLLVFELCTILAAIMITTPNVPLSGNTAMVESAHESPARADDVSALPPTEREAMPMTHDAANHDSSPHP